ncbi:hypothetical protein GCM10028832_16710 [Streptomyces sparsus]
MRTTLRAALTAAAATAAALTLVSGTASADAKPEVHANTQVKKTFTLWVGKPAGATIRTAPYATGTVTSRVPQGGSVHNIECGLINNKGNYWYRINSIPYSTYVYSGNLSSAPGIPRC